MLGITGARLLWQQALLSTLRIVTRNGFPGANPAGRLGFMPLKTTAGNHGEAAKGRGSPINPEGRFEKWARDAADDGWFQEAPDEPAKPKTVITIERVKTIITR